MTGLKRSASGLSMKNIGHESALISLVVVFPRVHFDALEKLEKVLQEREEFERKIAFEQSAPKPNDSEEELEELCRLASDVPSLWHHAVVTNQERKEILRCLIDHIVVARPRKKSMRRFFGSRAAKRR